MSAPEPVFLSHFLRLALPPLKAHPFPPEFQQKLEPAPPLAADVALAPWSEGSGAEALSFRAAVARDLEALPDVEAYQHLLPPPAFRDGDLPEATMLPTVHFWAIINAWQPMMRVYNLEEEIGFGGHDASGSVRGPLHVGDHLPLHEAQRVPRQLVFRRSAPEKILAPVVVAAPWTLSLAALPELVTKHASAKQLEAAAAQEPAARALADTLAYMQSTGASFALLTTYEHFVFLRSGAQGEVQVSEPIAAGDKDVTVYAAMWMWGRDVAKAA